MLTPLTQEHLDLADKVKNHMWEHLNPPQPLNSIEKPAIAYFLLAQFQAEDKNFDRANWLKACGL